MARRLQGLGQRAAAPQGILNDTGDVNAGGTGVGEGRHGRDEVVAGDGDLVTDGQVMQSGNDAAGTTLDLGGRVGELLRQGVRSVGPAGVRRNRPGQPDVRQRAEPLGQPFNDSGEVLGT